MRVLDGVIYWSCSERAMALAISSSSSVSSPVEDAAAVALPEAVEELGAG